MQRAKARAREGGGDQIRLLGGGAPFHQGGSEGICSSVTLISTITFGAGWTQEELCLVVAVCHVLVLY